MQKNKEIRHTMISSIAISTIFIASFMLSGSQFSQQALAIHEGNATTATAQSQLTAGNATGTPTQPQASIAGNTTAPSTPTTGATPDTTTQTQAVPGGNATETGVASAQTPTPTAAVQEPPVNQNFVRQATVASSTELPIAGPEGQNFAFILPLRSDGGVYSGVLTYTASKPVGVAVIHNYDPQNSTAIPEEYGTELTSPLPGGAGNIAITLFQPPYDSGVNAASVPFTGNGLALHTLEDDPFTATYTVNAFATQPESANAPLEFTSVEGEVEEPAAEDEEAADEEDAAGAEEDAEGEDAEGEDAEGEDAEGEDTEGDGTQ
jgi:hypothetical protein